MPDDKPEKQCVARGPSSVQWYGGDLSFGSRDLYQVGGLTYEVKVDPSQVVWFGGHGTQPGTRDIYRDIFVEPVEQSAPDVAKEDMTVGEMYARLSRQMTKEHHRTRDVVKSEAAELRQHLVECIKETPATALDLFSKYVLILSAFCLLVQLVSGFSIVHPFMALLLVASSIAGIGMAKRNRRRSEEGQDVVS